MIRVVVDSETIAKFKGLSDSIEFCDASGRKLGYFFPGLPPLRAPDGSLFVPLTDEEVIERHQQRTGRPLNDILRDFQGSDPSD